MHGHSISIFIYFYFKYFLNLTDLPSVSEFSVLTIVPTNNTSVWLQVIYLAVPSL